MELEFTARFIKLRSKVRNQRSVKDTDKVIEVLRNTPNMFELHKILDLKYRAVDGTYRIRYSNKPEMRIVFNQKEVIVTNDFQKTDEKKWSWDNPQSHGKNDNKTEKQNKKQVLELLWIGSREEYGKFSNNAITEETDNKFNISITEKQLNILMLENLEDLEDLDNIETDDIENELNFTPEKFGKMVRSVGIIYPDIAIAQSLLETGHFKSKIFNDNNNLFGMKNPSKRNTLSKGTKNGHAYYDTWQDSVKDYKLWQSSMKFDQYSRDQYFSKLDTIYCPPPDCLSKEYSRNVKSLLPKANDILGQKYIIKKIKSTKPPVKKIIKNPKKLNEHSYMGKYEGDKITVGEFSKRKMPRPVVKNVLRAISNVLQSDVKQSKLKNGEYDDVEIRLFGQLLSFLNGTY
jgi:uncharacterized FlgJ-related protein